MPKNFRVSNGIFRALFVAILLAPSVGGTALEPYEQDFIITAYYSPEPNQCCYVKGGYKADQILNGEGFKAADGTAVYPGMLAAPPSYAYGTKVDLPGLGVLTVHDRGGAIQQQANGDRLDIWMGHGEEGLARALEFGVVRVKGTVYPPAFAQPETDFDPKRVALNLNRLRSYQIESANLMNLRPERGDKNLSTTLLQESLKELGYFHQGATGLYGEVTEAALAQFLRDYQVQQPTDALTREAAAHLLAAKQRQGSRDPIATQIGPQSSVAAIQQAQRTLRFLGYYRGRTDGEYNEQLAEAIYNFQEQYALAGNRDLPYAGLIGPKTMKELRAKWDRTLVDSLASRYLTLNKVEQHLKKTGQQIAAFMEEGSRGNQVRLLQQMLAGADHFPADKINGNFGPLTKQAVTDYQLERGLISGNSHPAAGRVGPATLASLQKEQRLAKYRLVRGQGWRAL